MAYRELPLRLGELACCLALAAACPCAGAEAARNVPPSANAPIGWPERARRSIEGNDVPAAQALAAELAGMGAALVLPDSIGALVPDLLRFLLDSGDTEGARRLAEAVLAARKRDGSGGDALEATLVNAIGEARFEAGDARGALTLFEQSLQMRERALGPNHALVAESYNNRGVVRQNLGRVREARADFERSLAIRERILPADHKDIAESVNALGVLALDNGDYAAAETWLARAMKLRERNPGPGTLVAAESANNLAELYRRIGDAARAIPLHEKALSIRVAKLGGDHALVAESLNNLALMQATAGQAAQAEASYRRAIGIYRKNLGTRHATVATLDNNLGMLLLRAGRLEEAREALSSALETRRALLGPDHPRTARSIDNFAKLAMARGDLEGAQLLLTEALAIVEAGADADSRWRVLDTARRLEAARGNRAEAIVYGKRVVNGLQALRVNLQSLEKALQQSFLRDKAEAYRSLVDLLIAEGRLAEAEQVVTMMKEDEYFDFVRRSAGTDPRTTQMPLTASELEVTARIERAGSDMVGRIRERAALLAKPGRSAAEESKLEQLNVERRAAIKAFNDALGEIHRYVTSAAVSQARAREIGAMNLGNLKSIQGTLAALGEGVVAVHYVVLERRTRILVTTSHAQVAREADIEAAELAQLVRRLRHALQSRQDGHLAIAKRLHEILVAPIERDLEQARARTLMLSLDGALRYLPFAALHDGDRYLIERYRLAMFSEAARDKLKDEPVAEWRVAALGVTEAAEGFSALPSVAQELRSIVRSDSSSSGILAGRIALDRAFSRSALLAALDEGFSVLHVASHFVFSPGAELESFLLLGDKSHLSLQEVKDDDYDFRSVELVTLSACETAVGGGADHFGREIEGFATLVQRQGARSVMATLWKVSDESTAQLMRMFYANRTLSGMSKAEALRQAQLALLRGKLDPAASSGAPGEGLRDALDVPREVPQGRYRHPFFWAPFILTGNWR